MSTDTPPRHGFRGDDPADAPKPHGLTVALSREAGSRGAVIAHAVGEQLGWQVFDSDVLDLLANDDAARSELWAEVPAAARGWADARLARLPAPPDPQLADAARLTLALAARGDAVIVGRAAGFLLPPETTVHVRIVAPRADRMAYLGQRLRLSPDEASAELDSRDLKRAELLAALTGADVTDPVGYDLVLNSARLGTEAAADLIVQAVRAKQLRAEADPTSDNVPAEMA
ncbi:MAG: AAA family ATPase [Fimbriiglobus sp.]